MRRFNTHYLRQDRPHAFLSASKYAWIRYSDDKLMQVYSDRMNAQKGTELHAVAKDLIKHKIKLPDNAKTMNRYVNDAIGFQLTPEQVLFVSENCYGTADAIGFRKNLLRIHDLKNGVTESSFDQLKVYAAMFCIEYRMKPFEIEIELRIYQNDEVRIEAGDPDEITHIMSKIFQFDKLINEMNEEAL